MPDWIFLGIPSDSGGVSTVGSGMEVGSTILIEGTDWGQDLINIQYAQAVQSEGGPIAFTSIPNRQIKLPFIYRGTSVDDTHQHIQKLNTTITTPGNVLSFKPENASWATLFQIRGGRVTTQRDLRYARAQIIQGTIELSTEPFGYTPTWMLAASTATVGQLTPIIGSVIGDVPAKALITMNVATCQASGVGVAGALVSWLPYQKRTNLGVDVAPGWYRATNMQSANVGSIGAVANNTVPQWNIGSNGAFPPEIGNTHYAQFLTPQAGNAGSVQASYRARHFVVGHLQDGASHTGAQVRVGWRGGQTTGGNVAPVSPWTYVSWPATLFPSQNSYLIDCGELTHPPLNSGAQLTVQYKPWPLQPGAASGPGLVVDVVAMLPVDSYLGYFTITPQDTSFLTSSSGNWSKTMVVDAYLNRAQTTDGNTFSQFGLERYRGPMPFLAPGLGEFCILGVGVASLAAFTWPATYTIAVPSQVLGFNVLYQPRWLFVR